MRGAGDPSMKPAVALVDSHGLAPIPSISTNVRTRTRRLEASGGEGRRRATKKTADVSRDRMLNMEA
jgi:hypothetical protein